MKLKYKLITPIALIALATSGVANTNMLQNPGFEQNPPASGWGNHIGHSIAPWVLGTGNRSNVVKVNNSVSISQAPKKDASTSGPGVVRHYLDIANGSNNFYQSFTATGSGLATYGGYFTTRQNRVGKASIKIVKGVGANGAPVTGSQPVILPSGNSMTDPWKLISHTAQLVNGEVYSIVISMNNDMNFDEGFVSFRGVLDGNGKPVKPLVATVGESYAVSSGIMQTLLTDKPVTKPDACCPPINKDVIMKQMTPVFQPGGGSNSKYRLNFSATSTFNNQMHHYLGYVNSMDPQINALITTWRVFDKAPGLPGSGLPTTPGWGTKVEEFWTTFSINDPHFNHGNTSQTFKLKPNHWYRVQTGTYFNNNHKFFDSKCAESSYWVNWMVSGNKSSQAPGGKIVIYDDKKLVKEIPVKVSKSKKNVAPKRKTKRRAVERLTPSHRKLTPRKR